MKLNRVLIAVSLFACSSIALADTTTTTTTTSTASNNAPVIGMPNPAAVYCGKNKGTTLTVNDAKGNAYGLCVFSDNSYCDEWAYFKNNCKAGDHMLPMTADNKVAPNLQIVKQDGATQVVATSGK